MEEVEWKLNRINMKCDMPLNFCDSSGWHFLITANTMWDYTTSSGSDRTGPFLPPKFIVGHNPAINGDSSEVSQLLIYSVVRYYCDAFIVSPLHRGLWKIDPEIMTSRVQSFRKQFHLLRLLSAHSLFYRREKNQGCNLEVVFVKKRYNGFLCHLFLPSS